MRDWISLLDPTLEYYGILFSSFEGSSYACRSLYEAATCPSASAFCCGDRTCRNFHEFCPGLSVWLTNGYLLSSGHMPAASQFYLLPSSHFTWHFWCFGPKSNETNLQMLIAYRSLRVKWQTLLDSLKFSQDVDWFSNNFKFSSNAQNKFNKRELCQYNRSPNVHKFNLIRKVFK